MKVPAGIAEHVALAPYTTLKIGGPARYFTEARGEQDVAAGLAFARSRELPVFILGGGSNLLVSDEGFDGLVIRMSITGVTSRREGEDIMITAGAGEDWDELVRRTVEARLAGLECLSGIPGSVGGTPVQNVGAYGQEVSETISSVRVLDRCEDRLEDRLEDRVIELSPAECRFSYRSSIFNTTERERFIVLGVSYRLREDGLAKIAYPDLISRFAGRSAPPALAEVRAAVREIRARKGMLISADDPDSCSAGSFFKNPVITAEEFARIRAECGEDAPGYDMPDGRVKVPAAWLIERAGFRRGYAKGRAAISGKHVLAIVNRGQATAREVRSLADEIQSRVRERFGVSLTPEPVFVGFKD